MTALRGRIEQGKSDLVHRTERIEFLQGYIQAMIDTVSFEEDDE